MTTKTPAPDRSGATRDTAPPPRRYLRTPDAAAHLGCSPATLEAWRVRGGGPRYAKLGRIVVYAIGDLDAWAEARRVGSTAEADMQARTAQARR